MGVKCVHCGEDCGKNPVMWDGKPFCCHGCKTVYQILNEKKLQKYYDIQPMSGIKVEKEDVGNRFAYLDNEEIVEKLLDFSDGGISKVTLYVPVIHCASCIWLLENLNTLDPAIIQSSVDFPKKLVSVTFRDDKISLRQLVELMASIHYTPEINLDKLDKQDGNKSGRELLLKIGIAGFSLLNVMMYNFPEYLPGGNLISEKFVRFFGWMSFILSLPVVFYSANDYYLSAIKGLKHKMVNIDVPISLGIFTLFLQSTYDIITGQGIGYLDSLVGLVFFLLVGKWYQNKTYQALSFERNYKSYFPVAVTKLTGKKEESVPLYEIKEGDIIFIRNNELIPVDSKVIGGNANIDYSFVTGESIPVEKSPGDMIFAGGRQIGSSITLEVIKSVEQSYLTQLWNQNDEQKEKSSNLSPLINKISEYFTFVVLTIALAAGIYWLFVNPANALFAFTSVLIIACPCALALTVPFTFGGTMREFGRKGFYIKNIDVIENLHKIDTVVFDKTGTITLSHNMKAVFVGENLSPHQLLMIKSLASHSAHPLSATIKNSIKTEGSLQVDDFKEIPGMGISGIIDGKRINLGNKRFIMGTRAKQDTEHSTNVYIFIENRVLGYFKINNIYREGLKDVINDLKKDGYKLYVLSGDNDAEKDNLQKLFGNDTPLLFNQTPSDKKDFIVKLKKQNKNVLMIGDGLNDAGALMESDAGITVADDIYSFSPACDGIIEAKKFNLLSKFLRFTHKSMGIVKISFIISFIYNIVGISFAVQGNLSPLVAAVLMPISSVSVVAFSALSVKLISKKII